MKPLLSCFIFLIQMALNNALIVWINDTDFTIRKTCFVQENDNFMTIWNYNDDGTNKIKASSYIQASNSLVDFGLPLSNDYTDFDKITQSPSSILTQTCYLLQGPKGKACCIWKNGTKACYDFEIVGVLYRAAFINKISYFLAVDDASCVNLQRNNVIGGSKSLTSKYCNEKLYDIYYRNEYAFVMSSSDFNITQVLVRVINTTSGIVRHTFRISFSSRSGMKMDLNQNYLVVSSNTDICVFNITDFTSISRFQFNSQTISTIKLAGHSILLTSAMGMCHTTIRGAFIACATPPHIGVAEAKMTISAQDKIVYVTSQTKSLMEMFSYDMDYDCNGCVCEPEYIFSGSKCVFDETKYPYIEQDGQQEQDPEENNNEPPDNGNPDTAERQCSLFCSQCDSQEICVSCQINYSLSQNGQCSLSILFNIIYTVGALVNLIRPQKTQQLFFFIINLEMYNYHRTEYKGFFRLVLDHVNQIQNNFWTLFPNEGLIEWVNTPFNMKSYEQFTNTKFLSFQGNDSIFINNSKAYLFIYTPFAIILFFILKKLFFLCFKFQLSSILRSYSFQLSLVMAVVCQNVQRLELLILRHVQILFSFDTTTKTNHFFSLFLFGFFVLCVIAVLPMSLYFHKIGIKFFIGNVYRIDGFYIITFLSSTLKPILDTAFHTLLFNHPGVQKLAFITLCVFFNLTFVIFQAKRGIFKVKGMFWIEFFIEILFIVLNFLLYLRHDFTDSIQQAFLESSTQSLLKIMIGLLVFSILYVPITQILEKAFKKKNSRLVEQILREIKMCNTNEQKKLKRKEKVKRVISKYKGTQKSHKIFTISAVAKMIKSKMQKSR